MNKTQHYAKMAYELVGKLEGSEIESYRQAVRGLPTVLHRNGLCAGLDWASRRKGAQLKVLEHIAAINVPGLGHEAKKVAEQARTIESFKYMLATREVIQFVGWLKRAAEARG